ncbi:MAG: DEAD/DEAH box helicase [Anaerolineaceae bacterium]|nr:DEAD/DEAH box helicase [Anaerolineaceae bacterium]
MGSVIKASPNKVIDLITEHPIWATVWRGSNKLAKVEGFVNQWQQGYSYHTVKHLELIVKTLGWSPANEPPSGLVGQAEIALHEPDIEAGNVDRGIKTVHLIAPTGSGKSGYAKALMKGYTNKRLHILVVPRRTLIAQMVAELRTEFANVFHYSDNKAELRAQAEKMRGNVSGILVTTPNSLHHFANEIKAAKLGVVSLEEYGQGVGMWASMAINPVEGFGLLEHAIQNAEYVIVPDGTEPDYVQRWIDDLRGHKGKIITITPKHLKNGVQISQGSEKEALGLVYATIIKSVGKVAVAFDNKRQLHTVLKKLREYNSDHVALSKTDEPPIRYVVVAETSKHRNVKNDLWLDESELAAQARMTVDPNEAAKEFDVYLYTTKMGTGVSITSVEIDDAFLVTGNTLGTVDYIQMLNRFRKRKRNRVLWTQGESNIHPNADVGKQHIVRTQGLAALWNDFMRVVANTAQLRLAHHTEQHTLWTAYQHEHALSLLVTMLERDGMIVEPIMPIMGVEPLESSITVLTPEEMDTLIARLETVTALSPNVNDRPDLWRKMSLEDVELGVLKWKLYKRFSANIVNKDLRWAVENYHKPENSEAALRNMGVIYGVDKRFDDRMLAEREMKMSRERAAAAMQGVDRVQLGSYVLAVLSPSEMEQNRRGEFWMSADVWEVRAQEFWAWINEPEHAAMYNRAVSRHEYRLERYADKPILDASYSAIRQIADLNGFVISKKQVMRDSQRMYVPFLIGLDFRWEMVQGRVVGWKDTSEALKQGIVPKEVAVPARDVDWDTLKTELWMQIDAVREAVNQKVDKAVKAARTDERLKTLHEYKRLRKHLSEDEALELLVRSDPELQAVYAAEVLEPDI